MTDEGKQGRRGAGEQGSRGRIELFFGHYPSKYL
jgi:hypothetical protein